MGAALKLLREVIAARGLFSSFYSDRGSHCWHTPMAGGKVDRANLTQFGNAMSRLGIEMIPAYSPEARGRSERAFGTHQGRLPQELALSGITCMAAANRYLQESYLPAFNAEFAQPALEEGSAFVPWIGGSLDDILCEQFERTVSADNCVRFDGLILQIPANRHRCHYLKARVRVHRYADGRWQCSTARANSPTITGKGKPSPITCNRPPEPSARRAVSGGNRLRATPSAASHPQ